ncbi:MAG: hypothetical protein QNK04_11775 [Myxococcota bacterium]|nr:hypothetical protein [Myxococcota bacterium]
MARKPLLRLARLVAALAVLGASSGCGEDAAPPTPSFGPDAVAIEPRVIGERAGAPLYRREIVFPVHTVDRIYKSMQGPFNQRLMRLGFAKEQELLWVTGYRSMIMEPDGVTEASREFMCHSNMSFVDSDTFRRDFGTRLVPTNKRLFSLAQGQLEVDLPEGFGVPVMSKHRVRLDAQILNHNIEDRAFDVRQRLAVDFVRDKDLEKPLKPLYTRAVYGMKLLDGADGYFGMVSQDVVPEQHGPGCMVGQDAGGKFSHITQDAEGREFTGFWMVEPGREVNRTLVTQLLALPYDTTLHYVAVHLHPYAESVELVDLTTGESVYKSRATQTEGKMGLERVEYFSSEEGIPLYADHEYELVSVYLNDTGLQQDAMATMFLYLHVKDLFGAETRAQAPPDADPLPSRIN